MRAVNLLPRELDEGRKRPGKTVVVGCAGAVFATAVIAGGYLQASSSVGSANRQLAAVQAKIAALPPLASQPSTVTSVPGEKSQRVAVLASVLGGRVAWDRVLREISLVLPDDVWLESLRANAPDPAQPTPTTVTGFQIIGYTYSQSAVARLLSRLAVVPDLQQVTLNNATVGPVDNRQLVTFTIAANLRPPGATS